MGEEKKPANKTEKRLLVKEKVKPKVCRHLGIQDEKKNCVKN